MKRTLSLLIVPFKILSHGARLLEVRFISNLGKELVDRFIENHIDPVPSLVLVINWTFLPPFELPFSREVVPVVRSACRTSFYSWAKILTRDMRSRRSSRGLSIRSSRSLSLAQASSWLLLTLSNIFQSRYKSPNNACYNYGVIHSCPS